MLVIALPGFTRGPRNLQRLSDACVASGFACVRPVIAPRWFPIAYMHRARLRGIAQRLAEDCREPVVIAGHSAGAAAGCFLAVCLRDRGVDVRGVVLIDGVDSPNHLIAKNLPGLADVRIAAVLSPPSPCNRQGALGRFLESYPHVRVVTVAGAGHGDIEGAGIGIYARACKDASRPQTADEVLHHVVQAIAWCGGESTTFGRG